MNSCSWTHDGVFYLFILKPKVDMFNNILPTIIWIKKQYHTTVL